MFSKEYTPATTQIEDNSGTVLLTLEIRDKYCSREKIEKAIKEVCQDLVDKWTGEKLIFEKRKNKKNLINDIVCFTFLFATVFSIQCMLQNINRNHNDIY